MNTARYGSWIEQHDPQTLPVQVCGVSKGRITDDGYGVECFANIREARQVYSDLETPDQNTRASTRFIGPCRVEIEGQPAMRYETTAAYRMYSA